MAGSKKGDFLVDVKYLNYIVAIAEHRNMTKAAEELFVTQSSLSQYLARLERELGTPLFFRTKNELVPTPAGNLYVDAAKKVIAIQKELYQNIAGLGQRGHITVGVTSNFALRMLTEIIPRFKQQYPGVSIEISEVGLPALKKLLSEDKLDIGVAAAADGEVPDLPSQVLRKEEVLLAVPKDHPYTLVNPSGPITARDFAAYFSRDNFILSRQGSSLRGLSDRLFASGNFTPAAFCETNSTAASRGMVAGHAGIALIAESCSVDRKYIRYYSLSPALYRLNVLLTRKGWAPGKPELAFYEELAGYFKKHTEKPYLAEHYGDFS